MENIKNYISLIKHNVVYIYNKGFFHLLSANYVMSFFTFCSQLYIANLLNPIDIGRIKILQSIFNIVSVVAVAGFDTSILRLCSIDRSLGEKKYIFEAACKYVLFTIISAYIVMYILSKFNLLSRDILINKYAFLYLLSLIPSTYFILFNKYLESIQYFKLIAKHQIILRFFAVLVILILTYVWSIYGYLIGVLFNFTISSVVFLILIKIAMKNINSEKVQNIFKLHWDFAKFAVFNNFVAQLVLTIDILIINYFLLKRELVGQYSFATNFIIGFNILLITVQQVIVPFISNKSSNLSIIVVTIEKFQYLCRFIFTIIFIIGLIGVPIFIHFFFSSYSDSIILFIILFVAFYFRSLRILQWTVLLGIGPFKGVLYINLLMFIINAFLSFKFLLLFGVKGVAFAQVITSLISIFVTSIAYNRLIKENNI